MNAVSGWLAGIAVGLLINEVGEVSPWLARKITVWAAGVRYPDREQELLDTIEDVPGKLFKLITACGYGVRAVGSLLIRREVSRTPRGIGRGTGVALTAGVAFTSMMLVTSAVVNDLPNLAPMLANSAVTALTAVLEVLGAKRFRFGITTTLAVATATGAVLVVDPGNLSGLANTTSALLMGLTAGVAAAGVAAMNRTMPRWPAAVTATLTGAALLASGVSWLISPNPLVDLLSEEAKSFVASTVLGAAIGLSVGAAVVLWGSRSRQRVPARR